MKPRQYTLNTGKTRITLQAGQTNIHKAAPGETYRVLKRQGENDQEKLADDVVASRHGQDLQLDYADGTSLTLQDWFTQSDTSVTLPADGTSTQVMTPASTEGAALADGSHVFYAHGSPDALASMTSGHPGLDHILSGLQNGTAGSGHPMTYLPQSHSYAGYLAGALGLGGVVGVAVASGHSGGDNGGKHDNGGGEPAVENAVQLNFVGGPALSSNDLNVEIYQADGKTLIGTGTLGPNGSVTVSAGSYSGVVIVKLVNSGGAADYLDEATGAGKDLSAQLWSMGVISGDNSTLVLNINVLTTLAYTKAQEAMGGTPDSPATLNATQVADTSAAISNLLGVDDILNTTVVATNGGSYDATDGLSAGEKYGLLLAAFSGAEANAGASTQTILDTVTAGITLGSSSSLSDGVQSLLIKGAAAATDTSSGLSLIIDTHAPVFSSSSTASADENIGAGQVVWTAVATDPSPFTYSLSTTGDSALFSINAATGAVTLSGNPDFESKASYSFTVVATDAAGNHSSQAVTLGINNLDEVAPTITSGTTAAAIDENSGAGQVIYTATATDTADISGGVTFSLKAGSDAGLTINPVTGAVTLTGNPDFESKASYSFTVVATDAAGNHSSQAVTLAVNNLDEVAPNITSGTIATAIDENSGAGQIVYTATATDNADISGGVTFTLQPGSDAGLTIDPVTGAVTLTGNPDFENKASYSFTVVATDAAGNHSSQAVTLGINNLDEVAPTITSGTTATAINENSGAGQVIYTATATDNADISGGVTFSLKAGSDAGLTIDPITGAVTLTGNPDFENKASYSFTVVATDAAGNHSSQAVTLGINNFDEVAPSFTTGNSSDSYASATVNVAENTAASTAIYTAQANDNDAADGGEHVTYSLADENGAADAQYFSIDAVTGAVSFKSSPDYEGAHAPAYTFAVVATDAAGHTTRQTVTVNVTDVDEIAPTVTLDGSSTGPVMLNTAPLNTYLNGYDTTALGDGTFLVTWASNNNGNLGIYAQRLSAQGVAMGDPVQLASGATYTVMSSSDSILSVTALNDAGAYAVAWIGKDGTSSYSSIFAQSFNADGTPLSAAAQLDGVASAHDLAPQIATLADGGYIVSWSINSGGIYVQRFDDTGVAVGNTVPLAVSGSSGNASPQVTVLDNGSYVVTWQGYTTGDYHIYVQQFDATGNGTTPVMLDATTGTSNSYENLPQITALANGGYVVTWSGYNYSGSNYNNSTYVQQFDATGSRVGGIVVLDGSSNANNGGSYTYPYVAALADGGYAITWMEYDNTNGYYNYKVYVQQFSAGGSKVGATVQLDAPHNSTSNDRDQFPRITALGDGGYAVTWMSIGSSNWDIYVQKFNASGVAVGDMVRLEASGGASDLYPQVTAVGADGEYMVTWYGYSPGSGISGYHLYVQKFNADGSTYDNLVVLNHAGQATVQSTETGTVYLVNDNVVVSQLSDITGAASDQWASTAVIANTSATISAANLADGTYHAWAVDAAGNLSVISGRSVVVDNTVPVFTSATTAADITDSTVAGDTVYTAAATDAHGVTYSLNDTQHFRINASTGVVTLISSPGQASGAQFIVTATDAAGNQTTQTVTYNVVDTTPPGVMLVSDADGVENSGEMVIVQSSEAGTVYLVSDSVTVTDLNSLTNAADNLVNSVAVAANVGTVLALSGLAEGTYHAYAVDASGNVSAISGSSVTVDNTAPVLTSSTPQDNGGSIATGANLTLTFSEDVLAGSGHITLVNESDSSQNKVIDITDSSQVSISGNTVTIDPTTDLAAGANYHVQIDSTALHDTAGNDYAGISSSTGLNFTTVSASTVDPSIVVFDLTTGQSSDHNGRVFDANTAYTIYIQVNSSYNSTLAGLDSNEMWSGAQNLGADDKIVLVGTGSDVQGRYGDPVMTMRHGGNSVNWLAGFSISFSSYNVAGVDASGKFSRDGNNVDLWNGTWTVNPNEDNGFAQAYLQAMPAGVLTSQGLAMP
ncbi:beta strand repeat-containing protein [Leclercia adecarboxylata]|uniref:beta strand repeat-containing protein n=2 Tax=Leclercia adecarboxylata TaxID=83655 RepID=UPI0021E7972C|nr:cadherin domain-containing protein [Leclercia adecarboxylata]MCV3302186.1 cadherin domain-containing protein [Leclercia adecarboxylata]